MQPKAESLGAVLSKTITLASRNAKDGVWEVKEWDDTLYRVSAITEAEGRTIVTRAVTNRTR